MRDFPVWHLLDFGKIEYMPAFGRKFTDGLVEPVDCFPVVFRFGAGVCDIEFQVGDFSRAGDPSGFFPQQGDGFVECEPVEPGVDVFYVRKMSARFPDRYKDFTDSIFCQFFPFQNAICIGVAGGVLVMMNCLNAASSPFAIRSV